MCRVLVSVLLIACLVSSCWAANMACKQTINGITYDLSPLTGIDTSVIPPIGSYNYYIDVCGGVQAAGCSSRGGSPFVCQVRKSPIDQFEAVIAYSDDAHTPTPSWTPSTTTPNGGVTVTFSNGDTCNLRTRTAIVDFQCDPSAANATVSVTESPQCTFNVVYVTKHACGYNPDAPSSSSSSTGMESSTGEATSSSSSSGGSTRASNNNNNDTDDKTWPHIAMGFGAGVGITLVLVFCGWFLRGRTRSHEINHDAAFSRMNA